MVREYVEQFYYPAATDYKNRCANQGRLAKQLHNWHDTLTLHWDQIHFGNVDAQKINNGWSFLVQVYLGEILPDQIQVELYAEGIEDNNPLVIKCHYKEKITGAVHGCVYQVTVETTRLATDFTARVIPHNTAVQVPAEANLIVWQR